MREETAQYELMGNVILCGDFNGRIGLNSDFADNDEKDEFLRLPKDYEPGNVDLINRKSRDPEHDLKGSEGNITCYNTKGNSIVDYLLIKEKYFIKVKDFEITEINELTFRSLLPEYKVAREFFPERSRNDT